MGRLIDVDDIIRIGEGEFSEDDMSKIRWLIAHIPTAYDVEKVMNLLEEYREEAEQFDVYGMLTDILYVVRSGSDGRNDKFIPNL